MPLKAQQPIIYLITSGQTTAQTTRASKEFSALLNLVAAAVQSKVSLLQLREKNLSTRVLCELATEAARIMRGSETRLLINDRADVALASGADGVHLSTTSLEAATVRSTFGDKFLIGVSTHSVAEARDARDARADFAVFGPVFETASKRMYGEPLGVPNLAKAASELSGFPLLALGGVTLENVATCARAAAAGVAAIRLLSNPAKLVATVEKIRTQFQA